MKTTLEPTPVEKADASDLVFEIAGAHGPGDYWQDGWSHWPDATHLGGLTATATINGHSFTLSPGDEVDVSTDPPTVTRAAGEAP